MQQSPSPSSPVVLGYWAIRGLAQPCRYLLEHTGTPYVDELYTQADDLSRTEWTSKKFTLGLPFPNLPYLLDGELRLTESKAILAHLGRKTGTYGSSDLERARIDMFIGAVEGLRARFTRMCYCAPEAFEAKRATYREDSRSHLDALEEQLRGAGAFAVGSSVSTADFFVAEVLDIHVVLFGDAFLEHHPKCADLRATVMALPRIAAYRASDKFALVKALNNKNASFR